MAYSKRDIMELIARKAKEAGLDPTHALTMASIESSFDPAAGTSHRGLYQFGGPEWKMWGGGKDITDPEANFDAYVGYHGEIKDQLKAALGRDPTPQELYLGWQQGAKGAADLIKNPEKKVTDVVPVANVVANGGNAGMTAGDFINLWKTKYDEHRGNIVPDMPPTQYVGAMADPAMMQTPVPVAAATPAPSWPATPVNGLLSPLHNPYASSIQSGMGLMAAGSTQPQQQQMPGLLDIGRPQPIPLPDLRTGRGGLLG